MAPIDRFLGLKDKITFWDEVIENYDQSKEMFREQIYDLDRRLLSLK